MEISIENSQNKVGIPDNLEALIHRASELCIESEGFTRNSEIFFLLTDNVEIKELNKKYRGVDTPTDVLSFPMLDFTEGLPKESAGDYDISQGLLLLGDVVISAEKAKTQAEEYGHSFEREILFLVTHGVYHLMGFDHENEKDGNKMLQKQEAVLKRMGFEREQD